MPSTGIPAVSSSVHFPSTDSAPQLALPLHLQRPPHLPFRRISLPSSHDIPQSRNSRQSMASFDSFPEEHTVDTAEFGLSTSATSHKSVRQLKTSQLSLDHVRKLRVKPHAARINESRLAKRSKVIHEFYDTEKSYVDGLDLIYSHFLTPVVASLNTSTPLLGRAELTSVFSNFIDIWNLHRSFFSSFSALLNSSQSSSDSQHVLPPLSPILLSHFPYLSLYTLFVTSFPETMLSLTNLLATNAPFAAFIAQQEADQRCGKLKLRDWLLTIVQRCPRYLLLLKDLMNCTDLDDPEHAQLTVVHTLVSKITLSLNSSLHTHAQTLALLTLQRNTAHLPIALVTPGRIFLRRGALLQLERSAAPHEREFLLFSDCLVWLASAEGEREWEWEWDGGGTGVLARSESKKGGENPFGNISGNGGGSTSDLGRTGIPGRRPPVVRTRSKSEAELSMLHARFAAQEQKQDLVLVGATSMSSSPSGQSSLPSSPSRARPSPSPRKKPLRVRRGSAAAAERWVYKGRVELVDVEVVVDPATESGEEKRFEILSPEASFAVYAESEQQRDEWASAIRSAKASLLVSLNVMHPNTTLTSSASTQHLRRSLQALPHSPKEEAYNPRRSHVDHFVPPVWIPDAKTESCMRCGRAFNWRKRRHHCRLCGRCVCASCSEKTFFITDPSLPYVDGKPARACNACYETVFPLVGPSSPPSRPLPSSSQNDQGTDNDNVHSPAASTVSSFPSWHSMLWRSADGATSVPEALMAIDVNLLGRPSEERLPQDDNKGGDSGSHKVNEYTTQPSGGAHMSAPVRIRLRAPSRPRSYNQILENFQQGGVALQRPDYQHQSHSFTSSAERFSRSSQSDASDLDTSLLAASQVLSESADSRIFSHPLPAMMSSHVSLENTPDAPLRHSSPGYTGLAETRRSREDTARRRKRFSLPAVALQTTAVTTRANIIGWGEAKRFSLVLAGKASHGSLRGVATSDEGVKVKKGKSRRADEMQTSLGVAAVSLQALLRGGRKTGA